MITVTVAGDFCPQARVVKLVEGGNFEGVFDDVKSILKDVDYAVVNFECPVVLGEKSPVMTGGKNLHCSNKAVDALKYIGFQMVTLANNHFYDFGERGVRDTINSCNKRGIDTVGGGVNLQEAQKYSVKKIKNKTVAFVNFCETEFSIATDITGGANPLNPVGNYYQITEAKKSADYVIVIIHGGHEYCQYPSPRMKQTYRYFVDIGADAVLNHHQHCYSGYEIYKNKPIFYGLGNFCFDNQKRNKSWYEGYMVSLHFNGKVDFQLHPYTQCSYETEPSITFMDKNVKDSFFENIDAINTVIANDDLLQNKFHENVNKMRDLILLAFEPYSNRYMRSLRLRKWIPSVISNRKKVIMWNVITCESHRDIVCEALKVR